MKFDSCFVDEGRVSLCTCPVRVGYSTGVVKVRYSNGMVTVLEVDLESWEKDTFGKKRKCNKQYAEYSIQQNAVHRTHMKPDATYSKYIYILSFSRRSYPERLKVSTGQFPPAK